MLTRPPPIGVGIGLGTRAMCCGSGVVLLDKEAPKTAAYEYVVGGPFAPCGCASSASVSSLISKAVRLAGREGCPEGGGVERLKSSCKNDYTFRTPHFIL
ncbi:hypothetical protein Hanom_Chr06g00515881 [Helianthus anomalus]